MRIVCQAAFLVLAVLLVLFAVSNRETVSVAFWPLPYLADVPLYLLCFLALFVGAVIGLGAATSARLRDRRELRARRRRIDSLERELTATQSQLPGNIPGASTPAAAPLPAGRQLR